MIPCTAEEIALELSLDDGQSFDPEVLKNAAAAVLHYFRFELEREEVSLKEFASALRKVLKDLGFDLQEQAVKIAPASSAGLAVSKTESGPSSPVNVIPLEEPADTPCVAVEVATGSTIEIDLGSLEKRSDAGELQFFQSLKADFLERLRSNPQIIVCYGLRGCAKNLCAARRWSDRCQELSDDIVGFLRACLRDHAGSRRPVLCIR